MTTDAATAEMLDHVAITRLQSAYGDIVNRRTWNELVPLFDPNAVITLDLVTSPPREVVGPQALGEFIGGAVERFEFFEFVILNAVVEVGGDAGPDAARGRIFMCELRQEAANGRWSNAFGVYHDDYVRGPGGWVFARRRYQSLARTAGLDAVHDGTRAHDVFPYPHGLAGVARAEPRID